MRRPCRHAVSRLPANHADASAMSDHRQTMGHAGRCEVIADGGAIVDCAGRIVSAELDSTGSGNAGISLALRVVEAIGMETNGLEGVVVSGADVIASIVVVSSGSFVVSTKNSCGSTSAA